MYLLPFENIVYLSNEEPDIVLNELRKTTEPSKSFRMGPIPGETYPNIFEGHVNNRTFSISPIINYRNSFLPKIEGKVEKRNDGTMIRVNMKLNPIVNALVIAFISIAFLALIASILKINNNDLSVTTPLAMFLFIYLMTIIGFKIESVRIKKLLPELLNAQIAKRDDY